MDSNNRALIFVKPDAVNQKAITHIKRVLTTKGIEIINEGYLTAEEIDSKQLIDKHYFAISTIGYFKEPGAVFLNADAKQAFEELFGVSWQEALAQNMVVNSKAAAELAGSATELMTIWRSAEKGGKVSSGLYMSFLPELEKIVINGFYPALRQKYAEKGNKIFWMECIFDSTQLSWKEFRAEIIGVTNPQQAANGSLRRAMHDNYQDFDIKDKPTVSDNVIHASAGPIEGLRERMVWLERAVDEDDFGKQLLEFGLDNERLQLMVENPLVKYAGEEESLFDLTEDIDSNSLAEILNDFEVSE